MCLLRSHASRFVWLVAVVLSAGLVTVATPGSCADADAAKQPVVARINVVDADLGATIKLLMAQTGAEIVIREPEKPYGRVTLSLENQPLDKVLKLICYAAGAAVRQEDGVYIVGPKDDPSFTTQGTGASPAAQPSDNAAQQPAKPAAPPVRIVTEKIRLRLTRPSAILRTLGLNPGNDTVNRMEDEAADSATLVSDRQIQEFNARQLAQRMLDSGNAAITPGAENRSINVPQAAPYVPTQENPVVPRMGNGAPGGEEGQYYGGAGGGQYGGSYGGGVGGMNRGGVGVGGGLNRGGVGTTGTTGATGASNIFPDLTVYGYDADNSIIVQGPEDEIDNLKRLIAYLDVQIPQVMIKAEFVTATESDISAFGINWSAARGAVVVNASNEATVGEIGVSYASGNVVATMLATLTRNKNHIIEAPMVTTMNNVPVQIFVGEQIPIITTSTTTGNTGNVISQGSNANYISVGSGVSVIPRINRDGTISMSVTPFLEAVSGYNTDANGNQYPVLTQQTVTVTRRVKDGDMIVIGGLQDKNTLNANKMIPILGDLPLIGQLFRSHSTQTTANDLLVFVTASIIPDPVTGQKGGIETAETISP